MNSLSKVAAALDERHAFASNAFAERDATAYASLFCEDLEYRRADGAEIGKRHLMRDVAKQLSRVSSFKTSFKRDDLGISRHEATETLTQILTLEMSAFTFVHRKFALKRCARYTWMTADGEWKIAKVHVLFEDVSSNGWRFGR